MKRLFLLLFLFFICFSTSIVFATEKIEINTASLEQLGELTGVGPVLAQRIIDARPYSAVDDLLNVKGIGPTTLQKIKDQGLAYVNDQISGATQSSAISENSSVVNNASPTQTATAGAQGGSSEPTTSYPDRVFINEIMPNPKGADETDEWIELYNSNNFDVDLSGWQIQDTAGTITTHTLPQNTKILSYEYLVLKRPQTKIMLNNDQDGLTLLAPDKKIISSVSFTSAPLNQSYNKSDSLWRWSTILTPWNKNIITNGSTIAKDNTKSLSNTNNSDTNNDVKLGLAGLSESINLDSKSTNPWFLFFVVLITTIILGIIVLFIKLKFRQKDHIGSDA